MSLNNSDVSELPNVHIAILFEVETSSGQWLYVLNCHFGLGTSQTSGISVFKVIRGIREGSREISQATCVSVLKLSGVSQNEISSIVEPPGRSLV